MNEKELNLRHAEYLARLSFRQRIARHWWIYWPAHATIAALVIACIILVMLGARIA